MSEQTVEEAGKPKLDPRTLREGLGLLVRYAREEPRAFSVGVFGSAVYATCTVGASTLLGHVTDVTIAPALRRGEVRTPLLVGAALALVGLGVLKASGVVLRRIGAGVMQYRLQAVYRQRIVRQYLRLPMSWHAKRPTGELLAHASSDVEAMFWPIAPFPFAVGVLVMLVLATVQLLQIDTVLTSIGLVVFVGIIGLNTFSNRLQSPVAQLGQARRGALASRAHESFDGAVVVKTLGREEAETDAFRESADVLRDANIRLGTIRGVFDPIGDAIPSLGVALVLLLGATKVRDGSVSAGELVTASYLFVQLAQPIRAVGWVLAELPRAVAGARRVDAVLAETARTPWGSETFPDGGPVTLDVVGLRHGYADGPEVLRGVDLHVPAGKTLAVVGATGSGKSTLADLLVRLDDPREGVVRWDGLDVRTLAEGETARAGAFVPQGTFVFDDTVRNNLTLGEPVTDAEVDAALAAAQATAFVAELPDGLSTELGERGTTLSGGQRQRIALARALVRRPRLLVLDDATSAVDPHVEQVILDALRSRSGGVTLVVVAYRRSTISLADEVAFLADGVVVARGTHAELLATVPAYRELVTAYDDDAADEPEVEVVFPENGFEEADLPPDVVRPERVGA